jgi:hypothetical protein
MQSFDSGWEAIDELNESWVVDGFAANILFQVQNKNGVYRLASLWCDNDEFCFVEFEKAPAPLVSLTKLPHEKYRRLIQGDGYGGDLNSIMKHLGVDTCTQTSFLPVNWG